MFLGLLLSQLPRLGLLQLGNARVGLVAECAAAPVSPQLLVALVEVGLDGLHHFRKGGAVAGLHLNDCDIYYIRLWIYFIKVVILYEITDTTLVLIWDY